jgi:hypothetical protein
MSSVVSSTTCASLASMRSTAKPCCSTSSLAPAARCNVRQARGNLVVVSAGRASLHARAFTLAADVDTPCEASLVKLAEELWQGADYEGAEEAFRMALSASVADQGLRARTLSLFSKFLSSTPVLPAHRKTFDEDEPGRYLQEVRTLCAQDERW